ncbi:MAG: HDIG domain-containing protein [Phycisphaerales bacterium]|nr:HDIG domain-containing protein [Phycisphaerales bacterium]
MSKDGNKPSTKPATRTGSKTGTKSTAKTTRRTVVRIESKSLKQQLADLIANPTLFWGVLAYLLFVLVVGSTMIWTRGQTKIAVGQIMRETRTSRVEFNTEDVQQTQMRQEAARLNVPRVYSADMPALEETVADLMNLPKTLAGVGSLDEVSRDIRVRFGLSEESFIAFGLIANDEARLERWGKVVDSLNTILRRRPLLNRQSWQNATQEGLNTQIELRYPNPVINESVQQVPHQLISRDDVINIDKPDQLAAEIARLVRIAGFVSPSADVVRNRLLKEPRPTFAFDDGATAQEMDAASDRIQPVRRTITIGQRIYSRGDVLEQPAYALAVRENQEYKSNGVSLIRKSMRVIANFGMVAAFGLLLGGYITRYCPKIASKPARIGWMSGLVITAIISACMLSLIDPRMIWLGSITPIVLIAVLITIAYDQRTGLAITGVVALIVAMSLQVHPGLLSIILIGIAAAVAQLGDLRERRTLIRMSFVLAFALAISSVMDQLINLPTIGASGAAFYSAVLGPAAQSFIAGLLVGGIALFILPFIERMFDITTGMTLIELRDPKQPILRELQQRAPGTYNHSLNVASIAESAAESINADTLLTYVGCLYHDIGKMNKPMYFIENQSGGPNKHDKLTPAMSLLVIVGHVKDGVEMAREHGLPKSLRHFIEAHHGTTLVEYFYRRAREQASQVDESRSAEQILQEAADQLPDEVDYRYPGPKPQTKEVAITMLADAVESATRSLTDPTPARIDALVRSLANKRLMDGQFDECDLTFRELSTICESISKTVASIYHGRIRYSSDEDDTQKTESKTESKEDSKTKKPEQSDNDSDTPPARSA